MVFELIRQPIKSFIKTISSSGTSCLDEPVSVTQGVKVQLVCQLCSIHGIWKVLQLNQGENVVKASTYRKKERKRQLTTTLSLLTCLLANTKRTASRSSSSANILNSSSRASAHRSLSLLSTTKIKPKNSGVGGMGGRQLRVMCTFAKQLV